VTGSTRSEDLSPALFSAARSGHGRAPSSTAVAVQLDALRIEAGEADVLATVTWNGSTKEPGRR